jgi:hypothetical protein
MPIIYFDMHDTVVLSYLPCPLTTKNTMDLSTSIADSTGNDGNWRYTMSRISISFLASRVSTQDRARRNARQALRMKKKAGPGRIGRQQHQKTRVSGNRHDEGEIHVPRYLLMKLLFLWSTHFMSRLLGVVRSLYSVCWCHDLHGAVCFHPKPDHATACSVTSTPS